MVFTPEKDGRVAVLPIYDVVRSHVERGLPVLGCWREAGLSKPSIVSREPIVIDYSELGDFVGHVPDDAFADLCLDIRQRRPEYFIGAYGAATPDQPTLTDAGIVWRAPFTRHSTPPGTRIPWRDDPT